MPMKRSTKHLTIPRHFVEFLRKENMRLEILTALGRFFYNCTLSPLLIKKLKSGFSKKCPQKSTFDQSHLAVLPQFLSFNKILTKIRVQKKIHKVNTSVTHKNKNDGTAGNPKT